ncbi:MAG: hypothetical protein LBP59_04825 [Planctomycetaceae bacterium]|nr:hypothetical protein [Planctomycetaceae bacterium]
MNHQSIKPTQCKWAKPTGVQGSPCRGRQIQCQNPEVTKKFNFICLEYQCKPPDVTKNFEYNLRTCKFFSKNCMNGDSCNFCD